MLHNAVNNIAEYGWFIPQINVHSLQ